MKYRCLFGLLGMSAMLVLGGCGTEANNTTSSTEKVEESGTRADAPEEYIYSQKSFAIFETSFKDKNGVYILDRLGSSSEEVLTDYVTSIQEKLSEVEDDLTDREKEIIQEQFEDIQTWNTLTTAFLDKKEQLEHDRTYTEQATIRYFPLGHIKSNKEVATESLDYMYETCKENEEVNRDKLEDTYEKYQDFISEIEEFMISIEDDDVMNVGSYHYEERDNKDYIFDNGNYTSEQFNNRLIEVNNFVEELPQARNLFQLNDLQNYLTLYRDTGNVTDIFYKYREPIAEGNYRTFGENDSTYFKLEYNVDGSIDVILAAQKDDTWKEGTKIAINAFTFYSGEYEVWAEGSDAPRGQEGSTYDSVYFPELETTFEDGYDELISAFNKYTLNDPHIDERYDFIYLRNGEEITLHTFSKDFLSEYNNISSKYYGPAVSSTDNFIRYQYWYDLIGTGQTDNMT